MSHCEDPASTSRAAHHRGEPAAPDDRRAKFKASKARIVEFLADKPSLVQDIRGFGPVLTAIAVGEAGDVRSFPNKHHFASYTGTSPMEASYADYPHHYVNRGGNRRLNHVLHTAAVVQISHPGPGQDYYRRKRTEGKSPLEAIRALKPAPVPRAVPRPGSGPAASLSGGPGRAHAGDS